jgi:hypothetical protein
MIIHRTRSTDLCASDADAQTQAAFCFLDASHAMPANASIKAARWRPGRLPLLATSLRPLPVEYSAAIDRLDRGMYQSAPNRRQNQLDNCAQPQNRLLRRIIILPAPVRQAHAKHVGLALVVPGRLLHCYRKGCSDWGK